MAQFATETEPLFSSFGSDPDLGELVEMFVDEMPDRIATLSEQLDMSDWDNVRRSAHQLKGAAGSYGFSSITPYAAQLESAVDEGQPEEQIRDVVDELIGLCRRIRAGSPE